jgi:hypothetical protein
MLSIGSVFRATGRPWTTGTRRSAQRLVEVRAETEKVRRGRSSGGLRRQRVTRFGRPASAPRFDAQLVVDPAILTARSAATDWNASAKGIDRRNTIVGLSSVPGGCDM